MASGRIENLGVLETQKVAIATGETSKAVVFTQIHHSPTLSAVADYAASGVWISALTDQGCTLNFADPVADKFIHLSIAG